MNPRPNPFLRGPCFTPNTRTGSPSHGACAGSMSRIPFNRPGDPVEKLRYHDVEAHCPCRCGHPETAEIPT